VNNDHKNSEFNCVPLVLFPIAIIEGDIVVDKDLLRMIERSRGSRQKRVARKNVNLWDDGLIPYNISTDVCKYTRHLVDFKNLFE
jgi:hypothetical protein